jgi:hypothetical protein
MRKAVEGRICTPERMARLYPIFREINVEMDGINDYWAKIRRKQKVRLEKKQQKELAQ